MSEKQTITVTVVKDPEGNEYHLETLLHEVVDRAHMCGLILEESLLLHPYFKVAKSGEAKDKVKVALAAVWDLTQYLPAQKENDDSHDPV